MEGGGGVEGERKRGRGRKKGDVGRNKREEGRGDKVSEKEGGGI